ncbi:MAG TPA: type II toxin-antitoxin system prevent-host-death family antitoxin [Longimicrobium sp.]|jgi:prevent-host-death family protein|nr:type II toxin-antitoxin system prevent-host-death family antitoxin [Longimicrobium sp.]
MRYMSIRDLRNQSGLIQRSVAEEPVTLTSNGRPFALVVGLEESEDPGELERLIRQARAQWAVSRIRRQAQAAGLDKLTMEEIDEEIRLARAERAR